MEQNTPVNFPAHPNATGKKERKAKKTKKPSDILAFAENSKKEHPARANEVRKSLLLVVLFLAVPLPPLSLPPSLLSPAISMFGPSL